MAKIWTNSNSLAFIRDVTVETGCWGTHVFYAYIYLYLSLCVCLLIQLYYRMVMRHWYNPCIRLCCVGGDWMSHIRTYGLAATQVSFQISRILVGHNYRLVVDYTQNAAVMLPLPWKILGQLKWIIVTNIILQHVDKHLTVYMIGKYKDHAYGKLKYNARIVWYAMS